ncbi:MAG: hypothetical protein ACJ72W_07745 [Actinoallomurus sp.]
MHDPPADLLHDLLLATATATAAALGALIIIFAAAALATALATALVPEREGQNVAVVAVAGDAAVLCDVGTAVVAATVAVTVTVTVAAAVAAAIVVPADQRPGVNGHVLRPLVQPRMSVGLERGPQSG